MSNKKYIVFDTETTGLPKAMGSDLVLQPHIVELYAAVLDEKFEQIEEFDSIVKPPIPIPEYITKINGISDDMVTFAPTFLEVSDNIAKIFYDCQTVVAHNLSFDLRMLMIELERMGREHQFPFPPNKFCTMEQSMHVRGYRLKNKDLFKIATGQELVGAHRAKADVMATIENFKWVKRQ